MRSSMVIISVFLIGFFALAEDKKIETPLTPHERAEEEMAEEICPLAEKIYNAKKDIEQEKAIAKESGAMNLTALNDAGRLVVKNQKEAKKLMAQYKKTFKKEFSLTRCVFMNNIDDEEFSSMEKKSGK